MCFGEQIKKLRCMAGMSQIELADILSVTQQSISKWESGISVPYADMLIQIADLFGVTTDEILGRDHNHSPVIGMDAGYDGITKAIHLFTVVENHESSAVLQFSVPAESIPKNSGFCFDDFEAISLEKKQDTVTVTARIPVIVPANTAERSEAKETAISEVEDKINCMIDLYHTMGGVDREG